MLTGIPEAIFYILAAIIIGSAVMVVTMKNIFHSALFLVLCFFGVAGIYVLLSAEFLAAVQVLIYVGAITVLMIFAIMLTARLYSAKIRQSNEQVIPGLIIVGALLAATVFSLSKTAWKLSTEPVDLQPTASIGRLLLTTYVLPFEIVSVVLLTALIGAIIIARRD
ncbi:MAG: NADH-quinone oxidoreductase subunit J [Candidatus Zixiibacteriota bacterium]